MYAGVDYKLSESGAIGLGLNSVKMDIGVEKNNLNGAVDWRYDGAILFYKYGF